MKTPLGMKINLTIAPFQAFHVSLERCNCFSYSLHGNWWSNYSGKMGLRFNQTKAYEIRSPVNSTLNSSLTFSLLTSSAGKRTAPHIFLRTKRNTVSEIKRNKAHFFPIKSWSHTFEVWKLYIYKLSIMVDSRPRKWRRRFLNERLTHRRAVK